MRTKGFGLAYSFESVVELVLFSGCVVPFSDVFDGVAEVWGAAVEVTFAAVFGDVVPADETRTITDA